ncbi:MAG: hypothetical protein ABIQ93_08510 [Saprospiraceae bacterium]
MLNRWADLAGKGNEVSPLEYSKLAAALRQIEVEPTATVSPATASTDAQPMNESGDVVATPETRALHKRHSHHHALMIAAKTDEERAENARIIMEEIIPELDRLYDLQRAKPMPQNADAQATERQTVVGDSFRKLVSVRSRISKLKRDIPNAKTVKRRAELETQLEVKLAEKLRLESV